MTRKLRMKRHIPSIKVVSNSIDKNWHYNTETKMFSHPIYPNKHFKAICLNNKKEKVEVYTNKFGEKLSGEKSFDIISTLYPYIPLQEDPRNIGYNIRTNNSSYNFEIIPNKMQSFWDTRRGNRYINYISYRKRRDANRKLWIKNNPESINKKSKNNNSTNA
jgi:hypothetical protein